MMVLQGNPMWRNYYIAALSDQKQRAHIQSCSFTMTVKSEKTHS